MTETIELPRRMQRLPVDRHGRPVPWFVAFIDGQPDHRIARNDLFADAVRFRLCWVCGQTMGANMAFVLGPMCGVNRITAEPPCHCDCAIYSARACPFLSTPTMRRRETSKVETIDPGGEMIRRNPGVTLVWVTRTYRIENTDTGPLFSIGDPTETLWYAHSRTATRDEILTSINTGLPILRAAAEEDGPAALAQLDRMTADTMKLIPEVNGEVHP